MPVIDTNGIHVELPTGWEVAIDAGAGTEVPRGVAAQLLTPRVHISNFPLPEGRGDFGSRAVEQMVAGDVFICLLEESPDVIGQALYSREGIPVLTESSFAPEGMQRPIRGQSGAQAFFHVEGRAFVLYVVMGSHLHRAGVLDEVNAVLQSMVFDSVD